MSKKEVKNAKNVEIVELGYRGYFILVSIFLLCACGIIALLINHLKNNNVEIRELKEKIQNNSSECPNNSVPVYLKEKDLVNTLFSNKLSRESTISEFIIDDIYIEDNSQFMEGGIYSSGWENVTKDSIFAVITYSVKPNGSYGKSIWNNGNGTFEEDWVKNKKSYIHIKKTNNGYVIDGAGYGTKWQV